MTRRVGSWPSTKAGNATEAAIDFNDRGGMLMIRRRISPRRTRSSRQAIASMCQPERYRWPGVRVLKTFSRKALKSVRNRACSNRPSSIIAAIRVLAFPVALRRGTGRLLQEAPQNLAVLGQHLFEMTPDLGGFAVSTPQQH